MTKQKNRAMKPTHIFIQTNPLCEELLYKYIGLNARMYRSLIKNYVIKNIQW